MQNSQAGLDCGGSNSPDFVRICPIQALRCPQGKGTSLVIYLYWASAGKVALWVKATLSLLCQPKRSLLNLREDIGCMVEQAAWFGVRVGNELQLSLVYSETALRALAFPALVSHSASKKALPHLLHLSVPTGGVFLPQQSRIILL